MMPDIDKKVAAKLNLLILCSFLSLTIVSILLFHEHKASISSGIKNLVNHVKVNSGLVEKTIKDLMIEGQKEKIKNLVEVASSIVEEKVNSYRRGELTEEEAQEQAKEIVRGLRYNHHNYFWITDYDAKMVMHAQKPRIAGKDLSMFKDSSGKLIFAEMTKVAKSHGSGFVSYVWSKDGENAPKISYVKAIPDWGWVIGTGIYIDDVDRMVKKKMKKIDAAQ